MTTKITKQGAKTVKTLIILIILTMLSVKLLPSFLTLLSYPALMLALAFLIPIFHKYRKTPDFSFFGNLCFATILAGAFFLLLPYAEVIGLMSFAILSFVYVFLVMASEKIMGSDIDGTLMTIIFLVLINVCPKVPSADYLIAAFLSAAVLLDLSRSGFSPWIRGLMAGLVWSAVMFGFSYQDVYVMSLSVVYSSLAGLVAGSLFGLLHLDDDKHIEKMLKRF